MIASSIAKLPVQEPVVVVRVHHCARRDACVWPPVHPDQVVEACSVQKCNMYVTFTSNLHCRIQGGGAGGGGRVSGAIAPFPAAVSTSIVGDSVTSALRCSRRNCTNGSRGGGVQWQLPHPCRNVEQICRFSRIKIILHI